MKKIIILLLTLVSITACADDIYYSNYVSQKQRIDSVWTDWTDWKESYTAIVFDHVNGYITVGDCDYKLLGISKGKYEDDNSITVIYLTQDANKKRVNIRFRHQNDGVKQLYIDYEDIVYCYNLM